MLTGLNGFKGRKGERPDHTSSRDDDRHQTAPRRSRICWVGVQASECSHLGTLPEESRHRCATRRSSTAARCFHLRDPCQRAFVEVIVLEASHSG